MAVSAKSRYRRRAAAHREQAREHLAAAERLGKRAKRDEEAAERRLARWVEEMEAAEECDRLADEVGT